jgi:hypothetical protein
MWLVRSPSKSQELFGDGSRQVGFSPAIGRSIQALLGTNPTGELITSGLPVIHSESAAARPILVSHFRITYSFQSCMVFPCEPSYG